MFCVGSFEMETKVGVLPMSGKRCLTFWVKALTALLWRKFVQQIAETCKRNIVAFQVLKRCWTYSICTHLKNWHTSKFRSVASWSSILCSKLNWRLLFSTFFFQIVTIKFCCVAMFEEGDNTASDAFQLATQH